MFERRLECLSKNTSIYHFVKASLILLGNTYLMKTIIFSSVDKAFVFFCLTYLISIMPSKPIHVAANDKIPFSLYG